MRNLVNLLLAFLIIIFSTSLLVANELEKKPFDLDEEYALPRKDNKALETENKADKIDRKSFDIDKKNTKILDDPIEYLNTKSYKEPTVGFLAIGLKGLLQFADNLYFGGAGNYTLKSQILYGGSLFLEFRFSRLIALELDFFMQAKGINLNGLKSTIWYASIVPYMKIFPAQEIFFIGLGFGIHFATIQNFNIPNVTNTTAMPVSYGISAGVGLQFKYYPFIFSLEYRFDLGLMSMLRVKDINASNVKGNIVFTDMQFMFGVGYYIF